MFKALLFDLDGTLLPNDVDIFISQYTKLLSRKVSHLVEPNKFIHQLLSSTGVMVRDKDKNKTNQEVFLEDFFQGIGLPKEILMPIFDEFYANDFLELKQYMQPNPCVERIMQKAFAKGFIVVVATNPVFPLTAIKQRLAWAGVDGFTYKLVTSYENMHFCKPNQEYYAEILELIGCAPEECLMIGNDVEEDLVAQKVGLKTFLVEDCLICRTDKEFHTDYRGKLTDLENFINKL